MGERACQSVGIDLGTTYSSLAFLDANLVPRVVPDSSGQTVMPSVVYFADEEIIVGEMALQQAKLCADRVVQFIKVHMGEPWRKEFLGRTHTPESVSAIILGQLVKEAEPQIGPIETAVITVPAYFTEKRRRATQQAGEIAGLRVIGTLNEPMAATLAYGLHHTDREQMVVVYDLGGGTFDVTVVRISPNELEELATAGNRQLGGRDWDQCLIEYMAGDFLKKHHIDVTHVPQAMQDLLLEAERAKRRLSKMNRTSLRVHAEGRDHQVEISRENFEELTAHLLQATKLTTEMAVRDAGLKWSQISRVVLVGGSTHMPAVRQMLKDLSGKPPDTCVNPVVAVSLGAAIYAHMLETDKGPRTLPRSDLEIEDDTPRAVDRTVGDAAALPTVRFVTAHGVGLKTRTPTGFANKVLIPKNTGVPCSVTRRFITKNVGRGGRQITIEITQGDTADLGLAERLGIGRIGGLPDNERDGQPVDVTMQFDEQGRLHISAFYVPRGQQIGLSLEIPDGLREQDVAEHRKFLEQTGFLPSRLPPPIPAGGDDDDNDIPVLEPMD
jgi:molecular chaperone DnaK